ncbi:rifampicin phosphotransferase isoform X2 [Leptinotarsa decemlineata]|uniref:rifampicin phosphotransferase isoform X2 n=1 Tax=Leptinotarsa decemlineata TaxID=7539 RepID=UPI003D30CA67
MNFLLYSVVYYSSLLLTPFIVYSVFFRKTERSRYSNKDWLYPIKYFIAKKQVKIYQDKYKIHHKDLGNKFETEFDIPTVKNTNSHSFHGTDQRGNSLLLRLSVGPAEIAELSLYLQLADGNSYVLPGVNSVLQTNLTKKQWAIGGAKIELLEEFRKLRIIFNGLLRNISYTTQERIEHVQFNFIFTAIASPCYIPQDIDETLLANALATKAWKDGSWVNNLMNYGFAYTSDNKRLPIKNVDIKLEHLGKNKIIPELITTHITVKKRVYKCVLHLDTSKISIFKNRSKYGYECYNVPSECDVNMNQGKALVEFWYQYEGEDIFIPEKKLFPKIIENPPSFLLSELGSEKSQILEITGGKGNSLALLTSLNSGDFIVPNGFIITTNAYKLQIESNPLLSCSISVLNDICCGIYGGQLEDACQNTVNYFKNSTISSKIVDVIKEELKKITEDEHVTSWAVRSSAIGEDSEELSAAGQNETVLGCQTEEQIIKAILACWASLYTYQSVQYRWQHGLPIMTEMAVVVQKMIPADCAGVLFTCNPSTSNPSQMVITSNFGLGETVVSGSSDPDTFFLSRSWDNKLSVLEKKVGAKNSILAMTSNGSTEMYTEENNNESLSLTDQQLLELGKVGVLLEGAFGSPRDIEWAYYKDKLYLLQSRPITTLNTWTDFELDHEMDTPLVSEKTVSTVGNTKEVIPRAATVLSQTSCLLCINKAMQLYSQKNTDPISQMGVLTFQHNIMVDVALSLHRNVSKEIQMSSKILDLAVFGHSVLDEKMNEMFVNKLGVTSALDAIMEFFRIFNSARKMKETLAEAKQLVNNLNLDYKENEPPSSIFRRIDDALEDVSRVSICHCKTTSVSVLYQVIVMNILLGREKELTVEHSTDFALILSSCEDVVSAEVPKRLEEMVETIKNQSHSNEFCELKPEQGLDWLENNCPEAKKLFDIFLQEHGHRSAGEFEVNEESWAENPSKVISMIQANIKHERNTKKERILPLDVIKNLASPKSEITRKLLLIPIKKMRVAVGIREQTKSEMVRAFDKIRQAYRHLSQEMVSHGLLPSKDLIYHLTHKEIGQIIHSRNPVLINKAMKRRKLYQKWDKLKFPEIMFGIPCPEDVVSTLQINSSEETCKGTPVCTGVVQARACVINGLDEIHQLQTGDILITYSTDIGWSPYFPMLSGIVTELGGLISHGAVVAREYGLPCIVGVKNVTKYFETGDMVLLNAKTGELGRIQM